MGEVRVRVRLTNTIDEALARRGQLPSDQVRSYETDALVDTGAVSLVIPAEVMRRLGLMPIDRYMVTYADGRSEPVEVTEPVTERRLDVSFGHRRNGGARVACPLRRNDPTGEPGQPASVGRAGCELTPSGVVQHDTRALSDRPVVDSRHPYGPLGGADTGVDSEIGDLKQRDRCRRGDVFPACTPIRTSMEC